MKAVFLDRSTIDPSINLSQIANCVEEYVEHALTSSSEVLERVKGFDIVITNKVVFDQSLLSQLPQLKLICIAATGTNNIDLNAANKNQITVKNVSGYSTHSVTQHVFTYLLNVMSNVPAYLKNNQQNPWQNSEKFCQIDFPVNELYGKKLGILGFGNLGQSVAKIAQAFGMELLISERPDSQGRPDSQTIRNGRVSFDHMLTHADVISLHCPLTRDNENLFNASCFNKVKTGVIFINTARGPIVNSQALADALKSGKVAHAIVDVLEQEPPPKDHPLVQTDVPNLTLTHHIAWGSMQAQKILIDGVVKNIKDYFTSIA